MSAATHLNAFTDAPSTIVVLIAPIVAVAPGEREIKIELLKVAQTMDGKRDVIYCSHFGLTRTFRNRDS